MDGGSATSVSPFDAPALRPEAFQCQPNNATSGEHARHISTVKRELRRKYQSKHCTSEPLIAGHLECAAELARDLP